MRMTCKPVNVLVVLKADGQKFAWAYTDDNYLEAIRSMGRCAANPEMSFTWRDAQRLTKKARDHRVA